jgi:hypothetical protein
MWEDLDFIVSFLDRSFSHAIADRCQNHGETETPREVQLGGVRGLGPSCPADRADGDVGDAR